MLPNAKTIQILARLSSRDRAKVKNAAEKASKLEREWLRKLKEYLADLDEVVFNQLVFDNRFDKNDVSFVPFVVDYSYGVMSGSLKHAQNEDAEDIKLAKNPQEKIPHQYGDLRKKYDEWKKRKNLTTRQKRIAEKLKKYYIKRCQSIWSRYGAEFRAGGSFTPQKVKDFVKEHGRMDEGRATTVVRTETTYYYNKVRRDYYDQSKDITHYLFVSVRDAATTKWCSTRQGLVYKKGDPLLDDETPPIHWNCRSEILPLSMHNPKHRALIEDLGLARRRHKCEPLPKGWIRR